MHGTNAHGLFWRVSELAEHHGLYTSCLLFTAPLNAVSGDVPTATIITLANGPNGLLE